MKRELVLTIAITLEDLSESDRRVLAKEAGLEEEDLARIMETDHEDVADVIAEALPTEDVQSCFWAGGDIYANIAGASVIHSEWREVVQPVAKKAG